MGGGGQSSQTKNEIAPELRPLYKQTGNIIAGLQPEIAGQSPIFFGDQTQQIPGFTGGQEYVNQQLLQRAQGSALTGGQQAAQAELLGLIQSPYGQSPAALEAMRAVRNPVLNDLALSGLGNSGAVGESLTGAYAPILAAEMNQRYAAIPQLNALGQAEYQQGAQNLSAYGQSEEQRRGIEEARGQAELQDILRRQGLFSNYTTGILSGFPAISGSTTKSSGGGK